MKNTEQIKIGIGLGDLKFGSTRHEVKAFLGEPEEISEDNDSEEKNQMIVWYYWSQDLSFHFEEEDGFRLGEIESSNLNSSLNEKKLIGLSKFKIIEFIQSENLGRFEEKYQDLEDKNDKRECLISLPEKGINFWHEDNKLTDIQWSYLIDVNDEIIWPKRS